MPHAEDAADLARGGKPGAQALDHACERLIDDGGRPSGLADHRIASDKIGHVLPLYRNGGHHAPDRCALARFPSPVAGSSPLPLRERASRPVREARRMAGRVRGDLFDAAPRKRVTAYPSPRRKRRVLSHKGRAEEIFCAASAIIILQGSLRPHLRMTNPVASGVALATLGWGLAAAQGPSFGPYHVRLCRAP